MKWGLWVIDCAAWLESYDPDGGGDVAYPTGTFTITRDRSAALAFDDPGAALECWRQVSTRTPRRPDGKPNRPLTALTVEVTRLDKEPIHADLHIH